MNDELLFVDEPEGPLTNSVELDEDTWKVLIVDDEPEVHAVTKLALSDFQFNGRGLEFVSAYSGEEAKAVFNKHKILQLSCSMLLWSTTIRACKWPNTFAIT